MISTPHKTQKLLVKFLKIIKLGKMTSFIGPTLLYNDEPKIFSFSAILTNGERACGTSLISKEQALLKLFGEIIERYNLDSRCNKEAIKKIRKEKINITPFLCDHSLKFSFNKPLKKEVFCIEGYSILRNKKIFVPAQLVFSPYHLSKDEILIRTPISTGAATHFNFQEALQNGILEIIERDAFMVNYLNKLSRIVIDISKSKDRLLKKIYLTLKRYYLELFLIDISTEIPIFSVAAILIDRTGIGPAVSVGLSANFNFKKAIIKAIEESLQVRRWIRGKIIRYQKYKNGLKKIKDPILYRGFFWANIKMIGKLNFFLNSERVPIEKIEKKYGQKKVFTLNKLKNWFKKQNIEMIFVDLTPSWQKKRGIYTLKTIIPSLQPLYLDERFPCFNITRIKEVPKLLGFSPAKKVNKIPHPFL